MNLNNFEEMPELLLISEVAKILRVSILTIKRWEEKGKITPIRINDRGDRRYRKKDIINLISK